jgi:hypothetical protein
VTHTELVHSYFGAGVAGMGILAAAAIRRPGGAAHQAWPVLSVLIGLCLFLPVEAHTRTYQQVGWLATLESVVPQHAGTWLRDWWATVQSVHAVQHKLGGLLAIAAGVVEFGVARGRLQKPMWGRLLPWFSIALGLAFGVHGGTAAHLPSRTEQMHHWILGAAFVIGGAILALSDAGVLTGARWRYAWPLLVTLAGLDLALFYRLHGHVPPHMAVALPIAGAARPG